MTLGIASSPKEFPLPKSWSSPPPLPQGVREDLETSLGQISKYNLVFKGISHVFSWASYLSLSEKMVGQLHTSRSGAKLYSSTFCIPKFIKKSFNLYDCTKTFGCSLQGKDKGSKSFKKIAGASLGLFLCSVQFLNKATKVAFCLNKTHVIDLTLMADGLPDWLDWVSFVTSLPGSVMKIHKFAKSILSYQKAAAVVTDKKSDVLPQVDKTQQALKVASNSLKVFSLFMVIVLFFSPELIPPMFLLGIATCSFAIKLLSLTREESWGSSGAHYSLSSHSIHYLTP